MSAVMTQTVRPLPLEAEKDTRAGNYFISNYPPFSFWTPQRAHEATEALNQPPAAGTDLGLYVHIPFCRRRCHFCYFKVYTDRNAAQIKQYTDAVIRELELYVRRPFLGGRKPRFVYFGGGTPSYLSAAQLQELTDGLKAALPWDQAEEIAFECEPGTLNEKKLAAIKAMGVTRLSLGVENFSDHVLKFNNRAHESKQVFAAYQWARTAGFEQINIDLIAGMLEETESNWIENVRRTIELSPDCVTIYQMEIPFNTTIYQQMKTEGKLAAPVADWDTKRRWVKHAFERLEQAGYTVTSAYTAVKDPHRTKFIYRDALWSGADMIATGVASFGHIHGAHYQNEKNIDQYVKLVHEGTLPIHRALRITPEESMIRRLVLQLKLGRVNVEDFRRSFGVDVRRRFADVLARYEQAGFLRHEGDWIVLDRDALLQVDTMLPEFFLPEHRTNRIV
jgi:oxygen-independent coproporphyrinogen-3 oxidase